MSRVLTIRGFERFVRDAKSAMAVAARKGARVGALRCIPMVHASTRSAGAVNTGAYLQGFSAIETSVGSAIVNRQPYANIIEDGRRPNGRQPPRDAIARWAQRKLGLSAEEAKRAAYPIAKAIAARGLQPRQIVGSIVEKMGEVVRDEVAKAILGALGGGSLS